MCDFNMLPIGKHNATRRRVDVMLAVRVVSQVVGKSHSLGYLHRKVQEQGGHEIRAIEVSRCLR